MQLEVHRLHDDAHATLAKHSIDAVPSRQNSADLYRTGRCHWLSCTVLHAEAALLLLQSTNGLCIVHSFNQQGTSPSLTTL
ncbi:MAG TPA: hypothetical protein VHN14_28085 [Kofleriaceae bacterium]|jgi:hypothetical protein|nr:hypothetical protein [Kofleriaceae bacterium]